MNRSVRLLSFRHFQDRFLTTNKEKWKKKTALCFAEFVFLTFRGAVALHDSNPYRNLSRIARCKATKSWMTDKMLTRILHSVTKRIRSGFFFVVLNLNFCNYFSGFSGEWCRGKPWVFPTPTGGVKITKEKHYNSKTSSWNIYFGNCYVMDCKE